MASTCDFVRTPALCGTNFPRALAANALLVAWALSVGRQLFINELAGTVFGPASSVLYDTLLTYLERGWQVFLWLGVVLVVAGWFTGSNATGTAVRTTLSGGLETAGARLADGPVADTGRWVAGNARWLRIAAGVLGAIVLLWATRSRLRGCSGHSCSPSSYWRSCSSWLGPAAGPAPPAWCRRPPAATSGTRSPTRWAHQGQPLTVSDSRPAVSSSTSLASREPLAAR
ncbi:MAG: hypothetical protein ACRDQD_05250 [Nocardioidaceae bacterium]